MGLPDRFIEHGSSEQLRSMLNIDAEGIAGHVSILFPELFTAIPVKKIEERI